MITYFSLSSQRKYSLEDVIRFNDEVYARRKPNELYIKYRFVENPWAKQAEDFLYIAVKNDEQIGQMLTMPAALTHNGKIIDVFWGQNYIVKKDYRKQGVGQNLMRMSTAKKYYMAYGMTSMSKNLHYAAGLKTIANLDFYMKWGSMLKRVKNTLNRRVSKRELSSKEFGFPAEVGAFRRIHAAEELNLPNVSWNLSLIETLRDKTFIDWRFFYKPNRYFMYAKDVGHDKNSSYVVIRPTVYLNSYWIQVVDYRCDVQINSDFKEILQVLEEIQKSLKFTGILIASSQRFITTLLEQLDFVNFKNRQVVTSYPFNAEKEKDGGDQFMVNLADSDWDMYNSVGSFVFHP